MLINIIAVLALLWSLKYLIPAVRLRRRYPGSQLKEEKILWGWWTAFAIPAIYLLVCNNWHWWE